MRHPRTIILLGILAALAIIAVWIFPIQEPITAAGLSPGKTHPRPSAVKAPPVPHGDLRAEVEKPAWEPEKLSYYHYDRALERVGADGDVHLTEEFVAAFGLTQVEQGHIDSIMNNILKRMAAMMEGDVLPYELPREVKWRHPNTTAFSIAGDANDALTLREELNASLADFLPPDRMQVVLAGILKSAERSFIFRNLGAYDQIIIFGELQNPQSDNVDITFETMFDGKTIKYGSTRLLRAGRFYRSLFEVE